MEWGEISEMKHLYQQQNKRKSLRKCMLRNYLFVFSSSFFTLLSKLLEMFVLFILFVCLAFTFDGTAASKRVYAKINNVSFSFIVCSITFFYMRFMSTCIYSKNACIYLSSISRPTALLCVICECCDHITERTFVHLIKVHQQSIFIMHLQTDVSKYIFDASSKPFNQRQYHPF